MKTAISLPDQLFKRAEEYAAMQSLSRSQLYTQALEAYLDTNSHAAITALLNDVYATEDGSLNSEFEELAFEVLRAQERID
jgi:metal-responsive CopG/Arc/MetJ family transcriptional regulator